MNFDECAGKDLVNKELELIEKRDQDCNTLLRGFYNKLCEDLCCVKIPEIENYGFLWLKKRVVYKKILVKTASMRWVGETRLSHWIYVSFDPDEGVVGSWYSSSVLRKEITAGHNSSGVCSAILYDLHNPCRDATYKDCLLSITTMVAEYVSAFNVKYKELV